MKKTIIYLVAIFAFVLTQIALSQPHLEVVWEKDLFPTEIFFAKFSPDGKWIYCVIGNTIKKMDALTGEFVSTFENKKVSGIYEMKISALGTYIITDDGGGAINLWDVKSEKAIKYLYIAEGINCFDINKDEQLLYLGVRGNVQNYMVVYDLKTDSEVKRVIIEGVVNQIQSSHDGKTFVTGSSYKKGTMNEELRINLSLWDAETVTKIKEIEDVEAYTGDYSGDYKTLQYSMDDKVLAIVRGHTGIIYSLENYGKFYRTNLTTQTQMGCFTIELLPDNNHFVVYEYSRNNSEIYAFEIFKLPNIMLDSIKSHIGSFFSSSRINGINYLFSRNINLITLLRQSSTGVEESINTDFKYNITPELIQIILINSKDNIKSIKIVDIDGKSSYQQHSVKITNNSMIIPNTFRTGTYFLIITTTKNDYSHKFQVVR